MNDYITDSAN